MHMQVFNHRSDHKHMHTCTCMCHRGSTCHVHVRMYNNVCIYMDVHVRICAATYTTFMCATSVVSGPSASIMRQLFSQYCRYSWPHLASTLYYSIISILRVTIVWATCTCRYSLSTRVAYRLIIMLYITIILCMICISVFILVYDQWTIRKYDWLIWYILSTFHYIHNCVVVDFRACQMWCDWLTLIWVLNWAQGSPQLS